RDHGDLLSFPTRRSSDLATIYRLLTKRQVADAEREWARVEAAASQDHPPGGFEALGLAGLRSAVERARCQIGRAAWELGQEEQLDRKSTRLNSSHVKISY